MVLKLYNTLTGRKEVFKPSSDIVKIYSCGPTVYAPPHIGNYRSFIVVDILKRYLEFKGYKIKHVMNITDIDDKTIRESGREGVSLKEFTDKYIKVFFNGLETLNIKLADIYPRATENIEDMVKLTKHLLNKGYAYYKSGSVYYDISRFKEYGKLSKIKLEDTGKYSTVEADEYGKDDPRDFALLKASTSEEIRRGIYYLSEWGPVRPGWHIECAVMSMKYLDGLIDIHTGGVDLIFPHHENEIALSEAFLGKRAVRYWVHSEHLLVNGEKMSKSAGNYYTLNDLLEKYKPQVIRYMLISTHYRRKLNFTINSIRNAEHGYKKLIEAYDRALHLLTVFKKETGGVDGNQTLSDLKESFIASMDDDLNTPLALHVLHKLAVEVNKYVADNDLNNLEQGFKLLVELSEVLGLEYHGLKHVLNQRIIDLIREREDARKSKDWVKADSIRDKLRSEGIILVDTPYGTRIVEE
ncbi:MAG: cysteine--tRNA ligase [Candidatus Odinarchaeum yellowstonii]|uniref:Cysteine--tRNA ligase n=1 Tax=Odinarchaeota yellowstonii (strain LCB_4) TaxID=1841599 RepID=A0AAF0D224_ODILC|nr:MAG: cysteine--tRNA ligase [Candidatus Odinarchaeum yellowstonii]